MPEPPSQPVSALLGQWRAGDQEALQVLIPLVYEELRRIARRRIALAQYERDENDPISRELGELYRAYALDYTEDMSRDARVYLDERAVGAIACAVTVSASVSDAKADGTTSAFVGDNTNIGTASQAVNSLQVTAQGTDVASDTAILGSGGLGTDAADAFASSASRPSTNAASRARALALSASCQAESAARSHTPSIMAAIIAPRLRASAPGIIRRRSLRRFDSMRRW